MDKVAIPKGVSSPQVAANHVIAGRHRTHFSRLLNFVSVLDLVVKQFNLLLLTVAKFHQNKLCLVFWKVRHSCRKFDCPENNTLCLVFWKVQHSCRKLECLKNNTYFSLTFLLPKHPCHCLLYTVFYSKKSFLSRTSSLLRGRKRLNSVINNKTNNL